MSLKNTLECRGEGVGRKTKKKKNWLNWENWKKNNWKNQIIKKPIKILKKPTGSVRVRVWAKPKKSSQTGLNRFLS